MEFRVLGPLEVVEDGRPLVLPSGRQRALLAFLLIHADRSLSAERIAEALWSDEPPARGTKALSFHVSRLRDALEPDRPRGGQGGLLSTGPTGYVLHVGDDLDARRFERLAAEGRERLTADPDGALACFDAALSMWRGDAYADVADEPFAAAEIARLEELRLGVEEDRLEASLASGRETAVARHAAALLAGHPLRERIRGQLMLALYRTGRQADALRAYDEGRRLLAEELGIDPSHELQQLQADILRQSPRLRPFQLARSARRNPFKGLRPFVEADSGDFFGREDLSHRLVDRLAEVARAGRLLLVVGPSGCGKSSVVRAGLVPSLRAGALPGSERWPIATLLPGARPFVELAAALRDAAPRAPESAFRDLDDGDRLTRAVLAAVPDAGSRIVIVIDQLEELFPGAGDETAHRFLHSLADLLGAPLGQALVVATLRADYLDRLLISPELGGLVRAGVELVAPLDEGELERAITKPAEAVGVDVDAGLAARLAAEVTRQPAALPLLQYVMTELFERAEGGRITGEDHAAIGGIQGALVRRADDTYAALDDPARIVARQVFLRLIALEGSSAVTLRRVPRAELAAVARGPDQIEGVLRAFGAARLVAFDRDLVSGDATVEIAHESLLSHWRRLAVWVDEERQAIWMRARLGDAAREWAAAGRDPGFLLAGGRLDMFASWADTTDLRLNAAERALLDESLAERHRQADEEGVRAARERSLERRAARRLRGLVAVFASAALVAGVLLVAVYAQGQAAGEQADLATAREIAAASVGALSSDPHLGLLLAVEAARATTSRGYVVEDAMDALHWALQESEVEYPGVPASFATRQAPGGVRGVPLVPVGQLIDLAIARAGRSLTAAECRSYLHRSACPPPPNVPSTGRELDVYTADGRVQLGRLGGTTLSGTRVDLVSELPAPLEPLVASFGDESGIELTIEDANEEELEARLAGGRVPDVAILARPADVDAIARQGRLMDLGVYLDAGQLRSAMGEYLLALGTEGEHWAWRASQGQIDGVPVALSMSGLIWYPTDAFDRAGYRVPGTWGEALALGERMVAAGRSPWCLGTDDGTESGASLADWVEELLLNERGLDSYKAFADGELAFDSPAVTTAVERFGAFLFHDGFVLGGSASARYVSSDMASLPMTLDPPLCWLRLGSSTDRVSFPRAFARRAGAFAFPGTDPWASTSQSTQETVSGRVYTLVVFRDRPEVRRLVEYLTGEGFASALAGDAGRSGLFPARVDSSAQAAAGDVSDLLGNRLRAALRSGRFVADASDTMPAAVADAFNLGMLVYLGTGGSEQAAMNLERILGQIQASWLQAHE